MNSTLKTIISFSSGNLFSAIISSVSVIFFARWVEPEVLGDFGKYGILTSYLGISKVVLDAAYRRSYVILIGNKDFDEAKQILATVRSYYYIVTISGILIFSVLALHSAIIGDWISLQGWTLQIILFTVLNLNNYSSPQYRSNNEFNKLNLITIATAIGGFIFLPFIYFFGFSGLVIRSALQSFVNIGTNLFFIPSRTRFFSLKSSDLLKMTKISLPLDIPNSIESYIIKPSINLYILSKLGVSEFGIFLMAETIQSFIRTIPTSINQILNAKVSLKHKEFNSIKRSFNYIIKPTLISTVSGIGVLFLFLLIINFALTNYLINYEDSLEVINIRGFEIIFVMLSAPFVLINNNLMYKERWIMTFVKIIIKLFVIFFYPITLQTVSFAFLLGIVVHTIMGYFFIFKKIIYLKN
jgi:O-antigen/teichoic acid export membrane protein